MIQSSGPKLCVLLVRTLDYSRACFPVKTIRIGICKWQTYMGESLKSLLWKIYVAYNLLELLKLVSKIQTSFDAQTGRPALIQEFILLFSL